MVCGKYTLEDGDEVVVTSPVIKTNCVGTISSVTDDAVRPVVLLSAAQWHQRLTVSFALSQVFIKLASGQKVRVHLDLLVHRRCELKPLLRTPVSGWTDVELI